MGTIYTDGTYRDRNPEWHAGDSAWKAEQIVEILRANAIEFTSCVEVGCGAGRILDHLAKRFPGKRFEGFDISPDAALLWSSLQGNGVSYRQTDFTADTARESRDVLLLIDVFEHVDDYMGLLRRINHRAKWYVFHIPLEMHVSALLRDQHLEARKQVGHLHYFSRATALATLADTGYRVVAERFTKLSQETTEGQRGLTKVTNLARRGIATVSERAAAKLLGGYSLLVLCRPAAEQAPQSERKP